MINTEKIEKKAIHILESPIIDCDYLSSQIQSMDKELSWDGYIYLYNDRIFSNKSLEIKIPIQIKGHYEDKEKEVNKARIQYPVELDVLYNYYCDSGVLYFRVLISDNKQEIFYNILYPSKIKSLLDEARRKKNKKTINITLNKLGKTSAEMLRICKQFALESRKQGSGKGQIVPKSVKIDELASISGLTATAIGTVSPREFMQRIKDGDVCLYANKDNSGIVYPVETNNLIKFMIGEHVYNKIYVNDICYYEKYLVISDSDGGHNIKVSNSLDFNLDQKKFNFKPNACLKELKNDARFLLALNESECMRIASIPINYTDFKLDEGLEEDLLFIVDLGNIFEEVNINISDKITEFNELEMNSLIKLVQIYHGKIDLEVDTIYPFNIKLKNKVYPLLVSKDISDKIHFINRIYESKYQGYIVVNESEYKVPSFFDIGKEILANLYNYDSPELYHQVNSSDINEYTLDSFNWLVLDLIGVYDINNNTQILELAKYIMEKLISIGTSFPYLFINLCQIKERMGSLSEDDKIILGKIACDNEDKSICCGAQLLLGEIEKAKLLFNDMTENERDTFMKFPIYKYMKDREQ